MLLLICQQAEDLCSHLCDGCSLPARPSSGSFSLSWPSSPRSGHALYFFTLSYLTASVSRVPPTGQILFHMVYQSYLLQCCNNPLRKGSIIVPILQMKKLRYRGWGHLQRAIANKRSWDSKLGNLTAEPTFPLHSAASPFCCMKLFYLLSCLLSVSWPICLLHQGQILDCPLCSLECSDFPSLSLVTSGGG